MTRQKVVVIGQLRHSEAEGLQFSITCQKKWVHKTVWLEVLPNAMNWPGIERTHDKDAYVRAVHADLSYREAANQFTELQQRDPQPLLNMFWVFRGMVYSIQQGLREQGVKPDTERLLVKHYVLRRDRDYQRIQREVETLENVERIESSSREVIPEAVRLFVWRRDSGRCVKCGSQQRLEFDHVIPISSGGSNTERNIQLLCQSCNRSKGATI